MIIAHWTGSQNSGLTRMTKSLIAGEQAAGLDSRLIIVDDVATHTLATDADVHVSHTHVSDTVLYSGKPLIWMAHGTPEVMFHGGYEQGTVNGRYGHGDAWMLAQFWLQHAAAVVTFWPRHQAIWESLMDQGRHVDCIPMGLDESIWKPSVSNGKFAGTPSVFTAENCYEMKWPLDLFIAWPWVVQHPDLHTARLHAIYIPKDQHRWWFPLVNHNGCSFSSYISPHVFDDAELRNAFASTDYYLQCVRYGDFNRIGLEASACGAKVISYTGNPYATYWIPEGDQRDMAQALSQILLGKAEQRKPEAVPSMATTVAAMQQIYERVA